MKSQIRHSMDSTSNSQEPTSSSNHVDVDFKDVLQTYRTQTNKIMSLYGLASTQVQTERKALIEAEDELAEAEAAQEILQKVAQRVQENAHARIAGVVSRCLEAIFPDPYEFKILFEKKRGRTEARLVFVRNDAENDPLRASGGGVVDVAAFALRLACLVLSRPSLRRVVVLDEPFRFVSAEYREGIHQMLETLSQEMHVQFIMVTHSPELEVGKVVRL